jgi:hypothetical protein
MDKKGEHIQKTVSSFADAAKKHYDAELVGDYKTANTQAKKIHKSFTEIVKLGEDARKALLDLVDTEVLPIAAMAATYSLKYRPERALAVLEKIAKEPGLIGFEAEQAIKRWKEGSWQLE